MGFFKKKIGARINQYRLENQQRVAANQIIRKKARAAALKEREKSTIEFAREREKIRQQRRLEALKRPSGFGLFGQPIASSRRTTVRRTTVRRPATRRVRRTVARPVRTRAKKRAKRTSTARYDTRTQIISGL